MSARRKKPTPAEIYAQAEPRELLGLTEDGRLVLWSTGRVIPVTQFQYRRDKLGRRWIDDGHFVIDWGGEEVVVHLGNLADGRVSLRFMCSGGNRSYALQRRQMRPLLRYKVIPDPVFAAEITAQLQELVRLSAQKYNNPDRQRGVHRHQRLFSLSEEAQP